jgi:hypothetical protein
MSTKSGRTAFEIRSEDRDYSGLSIENKFLSDRDIERSFFNGVNLVNCAFDTVKMNNTEFSEATVRRCNLANSDLSGSDFVDSLFEDTTFVGCSFEKGEWRDAVFRRCRFIQCNFYHTTITLCVFLLCEFDEKTIVSAEHRAVYFNVFSRGKFGRKISDITFSSRNFGVPASKNHGTVVPTGAQTTIEQLCLLNNIDHLRAIDVAGVAESICTSLATGAHTRTSTLVFFSKIVRALTDEHRISATSLIYLEQTIKQFAGSVDDQDLFTAAMTAVIEIRSALFSVASETSSQEWATSGETPRDITIRFSETYSRRQAEILGETLAHVSGAHGQALVISTFRNGSTLVEFVTANAMTLGALLVSINFVLRQAKVTVKLWNELKRVFVRERPKKRAGGKTKAVARLPGRVPAVLRTGPVVRELAPVRTAVARHGRTLVEMDEKAEITVVVHVSQVDVGTARVD